MSTPLVLPALGSDANTEGEIISIVPAGTTVNSGDILMEVETDKVVLEIPTTQSGTISNLTVKVGDKVTSGMVFGSLSSNDSDNSAGEKTNRAAADTADNCETSAAPAIAETTAAIAAPAQEISSPIASLPSIPSAPTDTRTPVAAGPAARRIARNLGIDIGEVRGTGSRERITREDIVLHAKQIIQSKPHATIQSKRVTRELPDIEQHGPVHRESLNGIAKATSRNMQFAWSEIPHAWVQEEIDITALEALRKKFKNSAKGDMPLTVTAILCKVVALALKRFPSFNGVLDTATDEIIYRDYINIGVAVDTPRGLVVPCLRDVNNKSAIEIGRELKAISEKAVAAKLTAQDFQGSGFTISNLGGLGVSGMFPIVNWPEVAILGVASSRERCVLENGEVRNRLIMPLTLGFDHRAVNGADAARFLGFIKQGIEEPGMLLIGG